MVAKTSDTGESLKKKGKISGHSTHRATHRAKCNAYRLSDTRLKNKLPRLKKHLQKYPRDTQAIELYKQLRARWQKDAPPVAELIGE